MKVFIKAFVFMVSCAVTPFLKLAAFRKINRCPAISNKLLFIPANELARRIRRKEVLLVFYLLLLVLIMTYDIFYWLSK